MIDREYKRCPCQVLKNLVSSRMPSTVGLWIVDLVLGLENGKGPYPFLKRLVGQAKRSRSGQCVGSTW